MLDSDKPLVVIHFDEHGWPRPCVEQAALDLVRVIFVDDRVPEDHVYELTTAGPPEELRELLGDHPIGSKNDARHAAIENRIIADMTGKPMLSLVKGDADDA